MLRQCITFLRTHGFSSVLPLDQHIYLHKMVGVLIGVLSLVHTLMHLLNFGELFILLVENLKGLQNALCRILFLSIFQTGMIVIHDEVLNKANYTMSEWLLTSRPGLFGLVGGGANPTGVALIIILLIMSLCSMPFVRRGGCFEVKYKTKRMQIQIYISFSQWIWILDLSGNLVTL